MSIQESGAVSTRSRSGKIRLHVDPARTGVWFEADDGYPPHEMAELLAELGRQGLVVDPDAADQRSGGGRIRRHYRSLGEPDRP